MEPFGKYHLVRRIGSGGMAEVFLASTQVAQGLSKQLVIKKIHPAFARSRQFASMFVDEARIALGLNHPNIVQVFDFGQIGDSWYLAMEFVEGLDLLRLVQDVGRAGQTVPFGLCAYVVQQAAKGLDYAHRKTDDFGEALGIVHRDVSPQNLLISWDGAVKIVDFGIARARDVHEEEGVVKGKFAYMAPEQARGEAVDRRADVYSLGVVLYELCTGRPLFPGKGKEVLDRVKQGAIPKPRELRADIPAALEEILLKALTFDRDARYQTGRDLQNALGRFQFEEARSISAPIDSGALAQFVAGVARPTDRRRAPRPPTAVGPAPARGTDAGRALAVDDHQSTADARPEVRERKHVFVVEGRICGLASLERRFGRRDTLRLVQEFHHIARELAYKHEAVVDRAEEGFLTLVVGLPVAGEDDASQTMRLALSLVEALDGMGLDLDPDLRLAVGIQRGIALLKWRKGTRFGYELGTTTTAIARRLAGEAAGADILCGGAVCRVAQDWNFEELTTIDIAGLSDTQPGSTPDGEATGSAVRARVYRLRGPKERAERLESSRPAALIGRDPELKVLQQAYRDMVRTGGHRLVLVLADEGVGKRSLVSAFLDSLPAGESALLRTVARAATAATPLALFADLARDLLGLSDSADPKEILRRLELASRLIVPQLDEESADPQPVHQLISQLLGVRPETGAEMDLQEKRERLKQLAVLIERRHAKDRPLVVVIEEAHWADEPSTDLFMELVTIAPSRGLLALLTARPDPRVLELAERAKAEIVRLEELDERHRLEFLQRRFAPDENVRELARHILARTGGNPLFINEMIDALVDRGILRADPGAAGLLRWVRRDAPLHVPTSIEALLLARIDQLAAGEKQVLVHASVLGRRFDPSELAPLVDGPVAPVLDQLVERRVLIRDGDSYQFRNELTMSAAYGLLPEEERAALHRRAADFLATAPGFRSGPGDAQVAHHLELSAQGEAAAERYLRAASHAVDVGGNAEALRLLTRAIKLLPTADHVRRFAARAQREVVLRRLARRPAQLREIDALRKEAEALGDPARLAQAHSRLAQFYIDVRKLPAAAKAVAPALQYAREARSALAEAEAVRLRSEIARLGGQNAEALRLSEQALALCGNDRESQLERATILNARGTTLWNLGRLREAIDVYVETLVIYRGLGLPRLEARSLNNVGVVCMAIGEPEEALAYYKSSFKIDQQLGDRAAMALKLGNIGQCYADLGDLDKGEQYLGKAKLLCEELHDRAVLGDVTISLGQIYLARGDLPRAIAQFESGLALARESGEAYQEVRSLAYLSLALSESGGPAELALEHARSATALARKAAMSIGEIYGLAAQGLALARLGRTSEGASLTAQAASAQEKGEQPEGAEQILLFHAQLCERAGQLADARAALERASAEVRRKAAKLSDELRAVYLAGQVPTKIGEALRRLAG